MTFQHTTIAPAGMAESKPMYSHVTVAGGSDTRTVYLAGQVGLDEHGTLADTYEAQVRQTLKNIGVCLEAAGATVADIVKVVYYIVNYDADVRPHVPLVLEFYGSHLPSTTLVPVQALARPGILFEMDVTAVIPADRATQPTPPKVAVHDTAVDVVVVGGGLSGLQAAVDCQAAGLSAVVLEARDRVGGKTWSLPGAQGKGMVELGGAWINDSNQSHMYALAKDLKLDLIQQLTAGDCVCHDLDGSIKRFEYGGVPPHEVAEADNMVATRSLLETMCHEVDLYGPQRPEWDNYTLEEFVAKIGGGATAQATARLWTHGLLGIEPREISALYFLDYAKAGGGLLLTRSDMKHGGQYLRIRQGAQSFSKGLAAKLAPGSVRFNAAVRSIEQDTTGAGAVAVTTEDGRRFRARRVIISVPTPLYKEITFSPPLPADKQKLVSSTTLGWVAKSVVCYDDPWWRTLGFSGLVQSFQGPVTILRDTSSDRDGHFSLTCFSHGDIGRAWGALPPQARRDAVIDHIGRSFGDASAAAAHIGMFEQQWSTEQWSQGCPCPVMGPGLLGALGHTLRAPVGGVHFVGTETAYEWKGYMEGAVRSGKRGADEVIAALGSRLQSSRL